MSERHPNHEAICKELWQIFLFGRHPRFDRSWADVKADAEEKPFLKGDVRLVEEAADRILALAAPVSTVDRWQPPVAEVRS